MVELLQGRYRMIQDTHTFFLNNIIALLCRKQLQGQVVYAEAVHHGKARREGIGSERILMVEGS